jgi:TetR/AcrR family transcriptional regulator, transcriptional repressor for nem operon
MMIQVAERLAQTRGFNGFSYADIASELGITKASLHYHFATKAKLGCALIIGYRERFNAGLADIEARYDIAQRLHRYVQLYESVLVLDRMCLCGMLAAEFTGLPSTMQRELRRFFDENEQWLERNLEQGRAMGLLNFYGAPLDFARTLTAALEGAMLLARSYQEPERFAATARHMLHEMGAPVSLAAPTASKRRRRQRR